jgi:putative FmdB family regulatory protein
MPIYEYECQACSHRFEEWQKMSDKPIKVCPKCKARKVEKLISHTSFQLKGGGWYSDLYASQKPGSGTNAPESGGEKPAVASTGKAESSSSEGKSSADKGGGDKSSSTPATSESKSSESTSKSKKGASKAAA